MRTYRKKIREKEVGMKCYYVGRVESTNRIVSYEGIIIEDLGDTMKCRMVDNYIYSDKEPFEIILPKKLVKLNK